MEQNTNDEFLKLYEPVHSQFSKFCRAISGNSDDSDDLIQDTLLNVLEDFDKIRNKSAFKPYIFSVASNLNKMKQRRQKFRSEFNAGEMAQIIDFGQDQEYLADFTIIYNKILSLPGKIAEALILFHISDLSIEEIQKIQGGSISGVKSRLVRGREKLLSLLSTKREIKVALMLFTL